jgi:hypothetical protein
MTAGVGTWEVCNVDVPGSRPLVVEDPDFRDGYEPLDPSAERALAQPDPGTLQTTAAQHDPPAPPQHTAAQNLPEQKTARQYALEHQEADNVKPEPVDPITGQPQADVPVIDPTTGLPEGESVVEEDLTIEGGGPEAEPEPEEDLTIRESEPKPKSEKKKGKKGKGKKSKK